MTSTHRIALSLLLAAGIALTGCADERRAAGPARPSAPDPAGAEPAPDLMTAHAVAPAVTPDDTVHAQALEGHPGAGPGLSERARVAARSLEPAERARAARTVASVNDEIVTVRDMERRLEEMHAGMSAARRSGFDLDRLLNRLVNDLLLAQEARALGMDREEPTASQVKRFEREAMLQELEREQILAKATVTDREVREAFAKRYRRVDLRVITVDTRAEAESILKRIRAGDDMDSLARENSHDPYAARGGLATGLPLRDLAPEIGELAASLETGAIGGPVLTDLGWSILRSEGEREADPQAFEGARSILHDLLTLEKVQDLRSQLAARASKNHPVTVDEAAVRALQPRVLPDGRLVPDVKERGDVVARIGTSVSIAAGEYADALLLRWSGVRNEEAARAAAPIILTNLIDRALLLAEARSLGYGERPEVRRAVRDHETQILVQRYLEEVIGREIPVTQEELRAYYAEHRAEFPRPPRLRVAQITVESADEAEEVAGLLRRGTDVAWLARQRSVDRFASSGGDRGWIVPAPGTDEMNDRMIRSAPGEVLGPLGVPGNFVIVKVIAREEQGFYDFQAVSGNVRNAVFSGKFREALDDVMTKLRSRARIEVQEDVLAGMRVSGKADDDEDGVRARTR